MVLRFASAPLADPRRTATSHDAGALPTTADEDVACRCAATLLITASTEDGVETLARRIHAAGSRAQGPFVCRRAGEFPVAPQALREYCVDILGRAAGGSALIDAIEEMPPAVQDVLIELLAGLELARRPSAPVRLISGTTVSLLDRSAAGTLSAQLFYRLNIIHLIASDGASYVAGPDDSQAVHVEDDSAARLPR